MCKRFHSCLQFDPFFAGSIAICASWIHLRLVRFIFEAFDLLFGDRFIFRQFDLYLCKLDLFARGSIYFCAVRLIFSHFDFM